MPRSSIHSLRSRLGVFTLLGLSAAPVASAPLDGGTDAAASLDDVSHAVPGAHVSWLPDPEFGGRIYVVEAGLAAGAIRPSLVLIHGLGEAAARDFYPILAALAEHRHVVAFDLPGFGHSTKGNHDYKPSRYAKVVHHIIERYAGGTADVMGHSMGGAIALLHAGTYPKQVRRLVVVDAAGILHREAFVGEQVHASLAPASGLLPTLVADVEGLAGAWLRKVRRFEPPPDLLLGSRLLREHALGGVAGRIAALALIATNFGATIDRVQASTLLLWGAEDRIAPMRTAHLLADRVANARLHVLSNVGHVPMKQAAPATAKAVIDHLDGLPRARGQLDEGPDQGHYKCKRQHDLRLEGRFKRIELDGCERIILNNVVVNHLALRSSTVYGTRTRVLSGIQATESTVTLTGGELEGAPTLTTAGSLFDLAGVRVNGRANTLDVASTSRLLCSVCVIEGDGGVTYAHGEQALNPGQKRL